MHPRTTHPTTRASTRYYAVQLDGSNGQLVSIAWPSPTDAAADHGPHRAGWNRTRPCADWNGRRTAPVSKTTLYIGTQRPG